MPEFSVNTQRFDPYINFKFKIKWDGRYVAGISKVSALKQTTEIVKDRVDDSNSSRKVPGQSEYEDITLERGIIHDPAFEKWANKSWNVGSCLNREVSLPGIRKDLIIEMYNEAGQLVTSYKAFRCRVSEFKATPELDASANAMTIETLRLENEGWERIV